MGNKHIFKRLKKKGIILDETVVLIVGFLMMIVIVIGLLYYTGLLQNFTNTMTGLICMLSAYFRGFAVKVLWSLVGILLLLVTITAISGGSKVYLSENLLGKITGSVLTVGRIATLMFVTLTVNSLFGNIPLMCNAMSFDMGDLYSPVPNNTKFENTIQQKITDCWEMYGAGVLDPLWGIDPPNPRICFVSNTFLKTSTNMKEVYTNIVTRYPDWKMALNKDQDPKIRLFCPDDLGSNPKNWDACNITNKTIYISFKDEHPYSYELGVINSFGTGICGGKITGRIIHGGGDQVIICVESLVLPRSKLVDMPLRCGDGICNPFGEDCSNCPTDCFCPEGQECRDGVCDFCSSLDQGCSDSTDCCAELFCATCVWKCKEPGYVCPF